MNILHVFKSYYPQTVGGIEQVIHTLSDGLAAEPYQVNSRVLTIGTENAQYPWSAHEVHSVKQTLSLASTSMSWRFPKAFRRECQWADIVHYHFPWPFMDLMHLMFAPRKPCIVTYHSDIVRQKRLERLYRPLMFRFLDRVERIIATSPNYLATSDVLEHYKSKTEVIPLGIADPQQYPANPTVLNAWRQRLGSDFFLFIGVIRYYKGLHILLEALVNSDCHMVIAGAGPLEAELKAQAESLGLDNITFLGYVSDNDKHALLELCHAVVFPSHLRSEAFGISLVEGAAWGKPLISSEIGTGTTFINIDRQTGIVVPPADPNALREALLTLKNDPELCNTLGKAARQRYRERFTDHMMIKHYAQCYHKILFS